MAVERWELEHADDRIRPELHLVVEPPPPRGRVGPTLLFVALLVGLLGLPVTRAALRDSPRGIAWSPRPLPATEISRLDPVRPMPAKAQPTSREPLPGIAFVSCTRLWRAWPDGSHKTLVLEMSGISSPAFAPSGRTIAFLTSGADGYELWMTAADGSDTTRIGAIDGNLPEGTRVQGLTWSTDGKELAFALVTPGYDAWTGGSSIFVLSLATGEFERVGAGWPAPAWFGRSLASAQWVEGEGPQFVIDGRKRIGNELSSPAEDDLALSFSPSPFDAVYDKNVVALRRTKAGLQLVIKPSYYRPGDVFEAPPGHRLYGKGRPVLSEDRDIAVVELVDRTGERDLGLLDVDSGEWTVLDYAWEPVTSPVPASTGSPPARRAHDAAEDLLDTWNRDPRISALLLGGRRDDEVMPFSRMQYTLGTPTKADKTWVVPAVVWGKRKDGYGFRRVDVNVSARDGRVLARPQAASSVRMIASVEDAIAALDEILDAEVLMPTTLPSGTAFGRPPIYAWSWRGTEQGTVQLRVPDGDGRVRQVALTYGDDIGFALGCGAENDPQPTEVAGTPALIDHLRGTHQVIWPATMKDDRTARFTVYGDVPPEVIMSIAEGMEIGR